ncbi:MAG: FAD-dependent oxidoreductase [Thermoplasmata archaeon]
MATDRFEPNVVVIGAGIIGGACAQELARRGHRVLILEAQEAAAETSCRAMGHLGAWDENEAQLRLSLLAMQCWNALAPELPAEVEFTPRGAIWVAATADEMEAVHRKGEVLGRVGVENHVLDSEALHREEPNLRRDLPGGLLVPHDVVIDAAEATRFLVRRAQAAGAILRIHSRVVSFADHAVRLENGDRVGAPHIVVAAGWRTPQLFPELPIRPRKGHIALTAPSPGYVRHQLSGVDYQASARPDASDSIVFSFQPRVSGRYLIGATRQYVGDSIEVDPRIIRGLLDKAREYLPGVTALPIERTWAGFRPATPDPVPIIGPAPGRSDLIFATGHEGIGITTALATGRLVAEMIEGLPASIPLEPYRPDRFPFSPKT